MTRWYNIIRSKSLRWRGTFSHIVATEAHLGSGELLRASSLREVVGDPKLEARGSFLAVFTCLLEDTQVTGQVSLFSFAFFTYFCLSLLISARLLIYSHLRLTVMRI